MYASLAIQDGHEQQHPDKWPTIVCGGGTGFRGAAPTIKTGGVLWLTCWSVVRDLAEARLEHAQTERRTKNELSVK
ncbi:hypothetical protein DPMN_150411 [Dreissena polymorpha]|uniref:Uncharacterized protein n=1 Tax=Dreissena polymorpha TaxID=45954 RepID=A0A9D4J220_DREPO|nr:hypothetical protein DPMN_150411 [Dreissena polymorpha]